MPAAGGVSREGGAGKAARFSGMDLLGTRRAGVWGSEGKAVYFRVGAGSAWGKPHRARVHGRSLGGFSFSGVVRGGICESADFDQAGRWIAASERVHCGDGAVCATGKQAFAKRDSELPRVSAAGACDFGAEGDSGAGENCLGRLPGFASERRKDCFTGGLQVRAWGGMRDARRRAAGGYLSPEPAEYTDGAGYTGDVSERIGTDSWLCGCGTGEFGTPRSFANKR